MSNNKLSHEIQVVQIDDENAQKETKTPETKNLDRQSVAVRICDIDTIKNTEANPIEYNAKYNNNLETDISKIKGQYGYFKGSQEVNLHQYWVQFNCKYSD